MQSLKSVLVFSMLAAVQAAGVAQTVTVGAPTSNQNGGTTTVTIPVTVSTPAGTTSGSAASTAALLDVTVGNGDGVTAVQSLGQTFMPVTFSKVVTDTAAAWNAQANAYQIPVTGTYLIVSRVRLVDRMTSGVSYGQGAGTQNVDGPYFSWTTTLGPRNGSVNYRIAHLNKGDAVSLFAYVDAGAGGRLNGAELTIEQVQ